MPDWERVEWTHEQLVALRGKYDDAISCVVQNRNYEALPVLEILAREVEQRNLAFLGALRLAASDSQLMTLT
jgi:hypothetical protein